jgi:hypothetical protein
MQRRQLIGHCKAVSICKVCPTYLSVRSHSEAMSVDGYHDGETLSFDAFWFTWLDFCVNE